MAYDILIQNAQILDGTGAPAITGNVAVKDGKIAAVGAVDGEADRVIDATGLTLAPGLNWSASHTRQLISRFDVASQVPC